MNKTTPEERRPAYAITWQSVESVEHYANSRYRHLDQRLVSWRERRIVEKLLRKLAVENTFLLDIPTGYGRFTPLFNKYGFKVLNGDLNLYALLYQQRSHPNDNMAIVANGNRLPLGDNLVDVIFNFRLLQHFKTSAERRALLQELSRVSGHHLIVSVYIESAFHHFIQVISGRKRRMTFISRDQWNAELRSCGLEVVQVRRPLRFFHAQNIFWLEKQPATS